jgi:predicted RNase H-like HicB family nuclease
MAEVEVRAFWDTESAVWVARSDNIPGLFTEADTLEDLVSKLKVLVPKLVEANDRNCHGAVPFVLQVMDTAHALEEALPHMERRPHHVVHAPRPNGSRPVTAARR